MKLLVTGGAGFIGRHLVRTLCERGDRVLVLDNLSTGDRSDLDGRAEVVVMDVRDPALNEVLSDFAPDAVFHLAAQANLRKSLVDPVTDADVNIIGTVNLATACFHARVPRLVFASSGGAVYGEQQDLPAAEDAPPRPASPYGTAKLAGENYLLCLYGSGRGPSPCFLRLANVYGPGQDPLGEAGVVAIFAKRLLSGLSGTIFGDGNQTRDFVFVADVVRAFLSAIESDYVGPINIGTGVETSILELHRKLAALAGSPDLEPGFTEPVPGELRRNSVDPALAERVLGFRPGMDLDHGLEATLKWFKEVCD